MNSLNTEIEQTLLDKLNEKRISVSSGRVSEGMEKDRSICLSSEFDDLIKAAAKCKKYASDILYDIDAIKNFFVLSNKGSKKSFLCAFREDGVDGLQYVLARTNGNVDRLKNHYSTVYRFDSFIGEDGFAELIFSKVM